MVGVNSATVFNVTDRPVRYSQHGLRVPGRQTADVSDTGDWYYIAALMRGDLVVLSETAVADTPVEAVAESTPTPEPEVTDTDAAPEVAEDAAASDSKKKQPSKAKEN